MIFRTCLLAYERIDAIFDRLCLKDGDDAIFDRGSFLKDVDDAIFDRRMFEGL